MALPAFDEKFWDSPFVSQLAFVPRKTARTGRHPEGVIPVEGAELGWLLFTRGGADEPAAADAPVVFYCHANAEVAADVEHLAPILHAAGACAVLAIDYRGYGWSTGSPSLSTLLSDIEAVQAALPELLQRHALGGRKVIAYGRSLGAACAVHAVSHAPVRRPLRAAHRRPPCLRNAPGTNNRTFSLGWLRPSEHRLSRLTTYRYANPRPAATRARRTGARGAGSDLFYAWRAQDAFCGLVVDSGLLDIRSLPMVAQMAAMMGIGKEMLGALPDPLSSERKLRGIAAPLLVLHSEADEIIPFAQAEACLRAAGSVQKQLHKFGDGSAHNDIVMRHTALYTRVLADFLRRAAGGEAPPPEDEAALLALPVRELKLRLKARGLDARHCIEKRDFVELLLRK